MAAVPSTNDTVIFDGNTSNVSCQFSTATAAVTRMEFENNYSGILSLTQTTSDFTIGSGGLAATCGEIDVTNKTIALVVQGGLDVSSGTFSFNATACAASNMNIYGTSTIDGTFYFGGGIMSLVSGTMDVENNYIVFCSTTASMVIDGGSPLDVSGTSSNAGELARTSTNLTTNAGSILNKGTLNISGTVELDVCLVNQSIFSVASGASLKMVCTSSWDSGAVAIFVDQDMSGAETDIGGSSTTTITLDNTNYSGTGTGWTQSAGEFYTEGAVNITSTGASGGAAANISFTGGTIRLGNGSPNGETVLDCTGGNGTDISFASVTWYLHATNIDGVGSTDQIQCTAATISGTSPPTIDLDVLATPPVGSYSFLETANTLGSNVFSLTPHYGYNLSNSGGNENLTTTL